MFNIVFEKKRKLVINLQMLTFQKLQLEEKKLRVEMLKIIVLLFSVNKCNYIEKQCSGYNVKSVQYCTGPVPSTYYGMVPIQ